MACNPECPCHRARTSHLTVEDRIVIELNHFPPEEDDMAIAASDILKFVPEYDRLRMIREKIAKLPIGTKIRSAGEFTPMEMMALNFEEMDALKHDGFLVLEWPDPPQELSASAANGEVHWLDWHSSETA